MVKSGLTEKRMQDKRFLHSEEAIINAFLSIRDCISVKFLISRAQISRSTFYRHHKNIKRIVLDYEEYLLDKYSKVINTWKKDNELRFYFKQLLFFIISNKKIILFLIQHGEKEVLEELIIELEPIVTSAMNLPKWARLTIVVYRNEITGLLTEWSKENFSDEDLNRILRSILYLTSTIRERLLQLDN